MRINNSKPLGGNESVQEQGKAEPATLGEIKPENGVVESVSVKYTMFLPSVVQAAPMAQEEAGIVKTHADMMQYKLQKALDAGGSTPNVKWEGPDFDAAKK
jgi:hypothetical protein